MEFKTKPQEETYIQISQWLQELFGAFLVKRDDAPVFGVIIGSALAQVGVAPWGEDDATITTRAYVVTGTEITPDLTHYLLRENDRMRFGAFGLDHENDIFFEHTIVGKTANKEEIKSSVLAVILTADEYDDKIIARWGGQRALDRR
jgi:hypothetical protein